MIIFAHTLSLSWNGASQSLIKINLHNLIADCVKIQLNSPKNIRLST